MTDDWSHPTPAISKKNPLIDDWSQLVLYILVEYKDPVTDHFRTTVLCMIDLKYTNCLAIFYRSHRVIILMFRTHVPWLNMRILAGPPPHTQ